MRMLKFKMTAVGVVTVPFSFYLMYTNLSPRGESPIKITGVFFSLTYF